FTAMAFAVVAAAMAIGRRGVTRRQWATLAGAGAAGFVLATAWPYYSVLRLIFGDSSGYDVLHRAMYEGLAARTFLAVPGVVALAARWRRDRRDPLALAFGGAAVIYAAGYVAGRQSYGRILPFLMLTAQLALAGAVVTAARATWAKAGAA